MANYLSPSLINGAQPLGLSLDTLFPVDGTSDMDEEAKRLEAESLTIEYFRKFWTSTLPFPENISGRLSEDVRGELRVLLNDVNLLFSFIERDVDIRKRTCVAKPFFMPCFKSLSVLGLTRLGWSHLFGMLFYPTYIRNIESKNVGIWALVPCGHIVKMLSPMEIWTFFQYSQILESELMGTHTLTCVPDVHLITPSLTIYNSMPLKITVSTPSDAGSGAPVKNMYSIAAQGFALMMRELDNLISQGLLEGSSVIMNTSLFPWDTVPRPVTHSGPSLPPSAFTTGGQSTQFAKPPVSTAEVPANAHEGDINTLPKWFLQQVSESSVTDLAEYLKRSLRASSEGPSRQNTPAPSMPTNDNTGSGEPSSSTIDPDLLFKVPGEDGKNDPVWNEFMNDEGDTHW
ncbi:hypothetical protein CPB84DRAFT_1790194 [Gymnopilus junonius]|uniref:Uncharacterized protein n=1 Tax=Gymnopilus junonius TaxID=109634 RepID=A0A9P5NGA2_GYMJU|nr:hypothetical protein CPB84DRAFT_1790194 [Gymnopilus junonius]